jgi:mono/diheme cytochrome c family protein
MKTAALKWLLIGNAIIEFSTYAPAQDIDASKIEYQSSCAACHGIDGKGNGPVSEELKTRPTDLTLLAKKNNGVFPSSVLSEVIDGTRQSRAHGNREMPIWGLRYIFNSRMAGTYLNLPYEPRTAIIDYLNRIQEK